MKKYVLNIQSSCSFDSAVNDSCSKTCYSKSIGLLLPDAVSRYFRKGEDHREIITDLATEYMITDEDLWTMHTKKIAAATVFPAEAVRAALTAYLTVSHFTDHAAR